MSPRRVVTGRDESGRSVVVSDTDLPAKSMSVSAGTAYWDVWGTDGAYRLPSDGTRPPYTSWFPPPVGFRYLIARLQPDSIPLPDGVDAEALTREAEEKFPGVSSVNEPDNPGMHTTQTVDVGLVLDGTISLELDDGAEVQLGPGDLVVQNGTRHAWRNRSDFPCTMAFVLIGAQT